MQKKKEFEIIRRVLVGEIDDYGLLVKEYQNQIFHLILKQGVDEDNARDLVQQVFTKGYRFLRKFRFESSFSTWICRIAMNTTSSYFSSKYYKQKKSTIKFDGVELEDKSFNNLDAIKLKQLIANLKPKYREVVVLACLEGMSYKEISKI